MQRSLFLLSLRRAGGFSACSIALSGSQREAEIIQRHEAEETAKKFVMEPMSEHPRSAFEYKGSSKGAEVGARNEAAFMDYQEFKPKSLERIFVMPGNINLLTVSPIYIALLCIGSAAWGIFYWDLYCRKNYETVLIARPAELK